MRKLLLISSSSLFLYACQVASSKPTADQAIEKINKDSIVQPKQSLLPYEELIYEKTDTIKAAPGTKSVLFNPSGSKIYAMNLEGMSIIEIEQATKKIDRIFQFKATPGWGWDYVTQKKVRSYQEKPVEACFTHNGSLLWVSLHNAGGIVPIWLDAEKNQRISTASVSSKKMAIIDKKLGTIDSVLVPLIETGKTPKVIASLGNDLLVSNWHSYNVSVLETDSSQYPFAKKIKDIPVPSIPRGIAVDNATHKSYIAIMGGSSIAQINGQWNTDLLINVEDNPRHLVLDNRGRLFVSYNRKAKVACIDPNTGKTLFETFTHAQPRTIQLSKNQQFLFVTCYSGDYLDVYKIHETNLQKIASLPCKGHPVGVDISENNERLEAWVCSYTNGQISVFSFKKK